MLVLLLAFALRTARLEHHDIWGDEALSVRISSMELAEIPVAGASVHPPLYYVLLYGWTRLSGITPFGLRTMSVLIGTLAVAVTAAFAKRAVGDRPAPVAAFVAAIAPFQIYYAQETRMYALVTLLTAALLATFLIVLSQPRGLRAWVALGVLAVAACYTHYYSFFVLAALSMFIALRWWARWRLLAAWAALLLLVVVAYVPWIIIQAGLLAGQAHSRTGELSPGGLRDILWPTLTALAAGTTMREPASTWLVLLAAALATAGLVGLFGLRRTRWTGVLLFSVLSVPAVLAWITTPLMPFFFPRFLILVSPVFYTLVACGTIAVKRRSAVLGFATLCALAVGSAYALGSYYGDPAYLKGGYGRLMAHIEAHAAPGDAIVTNNPDQRAIYDYYAPSDIPRYEFPMAFPLDDPRTTDALKRIAAEHPRVWLVLYGDATPYDPGRLVERWLGSHGAKSFHGDYADAGLDLYVMGAAGSAPEMPVGAVFDDTIELVGYRLEPEVATPGSTVVLHLHWRALRDIERRYTVFSHLLDPSGALVAQMDGEPVGGTHPTTDWVPGEEVHDRRGLELAPDLPPGVHCIEVGWYFLPTMERLPVQGASLTGDDRVLLCPVTIGG